MDSVVVLFIVILFSAAGSPREFVCPGEKLLWAPYDVIIFKPQTKNRPTALQSVESTSKRGRPDSDGVLLNFKLLYFSNSEALRLGTRGKLLSPLPPPPSWRPYFLDNKLNNILFSLYKDCTFSWCMNVQLRLAKTDINAQC